MKKGKQQNTGNGLMFDNAAAHFKRKPEICVKSGYEVIATIWQIGFREYFIGKGKDKITRKTGAYLGTLKVDDNGNMSFSMVVPLQVPSHAPKRFEIKDDSSYCQLLATAYIAYNEVIRQKGAAA